MYITAFIISFGLGVAATKGIHLVAQKLKWVSIPREERWNTRRVALMGGIGVFISFVITFLILQLFEFQMLALGALLMFVAGFWDDRRELKPITKFLLQFIAASILVTSGYTISSTWPFWIAIPLTYLWIVGITNAFNLLDNMDGLAAGIAVIAFLTLGGLALQLNESPVAILTFILAGSIAGFLVFNYNPAKIFMGDCGSLFIGFMLAALPLQLEPALSAVAPASILPVLVGIAILPIFDTTMVTFVRIFKGRSPSKGGSDHSSHRLVFSGLSEKGAVHTFYAIAVLFSMNLLLFYPGQIHLFYILFTIAIVGAIFFGLYLSRMEVYGNSKLSTFESMVESIPPYVKRKIPLVALFTDIILVITAFMLAHYMRFEGWTPGIEEAVMSVLSGVIVIKILLFAATGLYESVWQYAGLIDLTRIIMATFLGSLAAGVFSWEYTGEYLSISVFAIDWFLLLFLLASSRFAFKGLRRLLALPTNGGENLLLYGAGDAGWLALREVRQNSDLHLDPIGFVDDSPYKKNGKIQGLRILGSYHQLASICSDYKVDQVLICIRNLPQDKKEMVKYICSKKNIKCKEFLPVLSEIGTSSGREHFHNFQYHEG